ncbi:MAG: sulfotransferase domain-containing protein [Microlunatus sp.]
MIVWLASYPRSGNTFLRIVINRLYGRGSSTVYPVDGVRERLGDVVAIENAGVSLADLRNSADVHFVKTHRRRSYDVSAVDRALYIARDGRDALVSFARQCTEEGPERYSEELKELIQRHTGGTASWGQNVLSWLPPIEPAGTIGPTQTVLICYEDLVRDPLMTVTESLRRIVPDLSAQTDVTLPTFGELQQFDPRFFRRGTTGTHRDEMPAELEELFWLYDDNREAMNRLGYDQPDGGDGNGALMTTTVSR